DILQAYQAGQRVFGENKVQEILTKRLVLPADIEWHMIGHLQTNKVKQIAPFISMIQSVDSFKLLSEISQQAIRNNREIDCLLQIHIATEESKFGFDDREITEMLSDLHEHPLRGIRIRGLMGMATFTDDLNLIKSEFSGLKSLFVRIKTNFFSGDTLFNELSMGMSGDYLLAIGEGSTLIRVGTKIFGTRTYL
ncbi:MAG: YggS family pyridoxal phosphate-dependent enzyme, partial [Bacteroidales bacterium]|nr:YggS family pyridoxal phosphate-dependent enzyme [Bacteroidales bacterium]